MSVYSLIASDGSEHRLDDIQINGSSGTVQFRTDITKAQAGSCRLRRDADGKVFGMHVGGPNGPNGHETWKGVLSSRID